MILFQCASVGTYERARFIHTNAFICLARITVLLSSVLCEIFAHKKRNSKKITSVEWIHYNSSFEDAGHFFFISHIGMETNELHRVQTQVCVCACVCIWQLSELQICKLNAWQSVNMAPRVCVSHTEFGFAILSKRENCIDRLAGDANRVEITIVNVLKTRFHKCWSTLAPIFFSTKTDLVKICISLDWRCVCYCCCRCSFATHLWMYYQWSLCSKSEKANQFKL